MTLVHEDRFEAVDFSPLNPFRKPEWRWLRHRHGCEPWQDACADKMRRWGDGQQDRDLQTAVEIYTGDVLQRAELEARLLARQTDLEIANRMNLRPAVIAWYESAFFDVRSKLHLPSWISHVVLKPRPFGVLGRHDLPVLWKQTGYSHGIFALEVFLEAVDRSELCKWGVDAYLKPTSRLTTDVKLAIASRRLPVSRTRANLLRDLRIEELSAQQRRAAADEELLGPLPMSVNLPKDLPAKWRPVKEAVETNREVFRAVV